MPQEHSSPPPDDPESPPFNRFKAPMTRWQKRITTVILMLIVLSCGSFCLITALPPRVPLYPGARNVEIRVGELPNWPSERHTTFQVDDPPDKVLAYYEKRLGWWNGWTTSPGMRRKDRGWSSRTTGGGGNYHYLDIRAVRSASDGVTTVDLWFGWVGS